MAVVVPILIIVILLAILILFLLVRSNRKSGKAPAKTPTFEVSVESTTTAAAPATELSSVVIKPENGS